MVDRQDYSGRHRRKNAQESNPLKRLSNDIQFYTFHSQTYDERNGKIVGAAILGLSVVSTVIGFATGSPAAEGLGLVGDGVGSALFIGSVLLKD